MPEIKENLSNGEIHILGTSPPVTKKEFIDKLWSLNPRGEPSKAYIATNYAIMREKQFNGDSITFDLLVEKYTAYLKVCRIDKVAGKYISSISGFIENSKYNQDFKASSTGNNNAIENFLKGFDES